MAQQDGPGNFFEGIGDGHCEGKSFSLRFPRKTFDKGWLAKRGNNFQSWRKRWCVLDRGDFNALLFLFEGKLKLFLSFFVFFYA